jgi:hypothetical protein
VLNITLNSANINPSGGLPPSSLSTAGNNSANLDGNSGFSLVVNDAINRTASNASGPSTPSPKCSGITPSGENPDSRLSTVANHDTSPNAEPTSPQAPGAVGDSLSSNAEGQQHQSSNTADSAPAGGGAFSLRLNSPLFNAPAISKPKVNSLSKSSSLDAAAIQTFFASTTSSLSPISSPQNQCGVALPEGISSETPTVALLANVPTVAQALQLLPAGSQAIQFFSQMQGEMGAAAAATLTAASSQLTSSAGSSIPANSLSPLSAGREAAGVAVATSSVPNAAVANADPTAVAASQIAASTSAPQTSITAHAAADIAQKTGVLSQVTVPSLASVQGHPLSSVLQQIASLQGLDTKQSPAPSVLVDLSRTTAQAQVTLAAQKTVLTSSSALHVSEATSSLYSSDSKVVRIISPESRLIDAVQNAASAANVHSSPQDSSSDHSGQKPSDSSTPSDSSSKVPVQEKNESSILSNALSVSTVSKPDTTPSAQPAFAPAAAMPPPQSTSDSSARPSVEPLPSAAAQAQQSPQTLQPSETPSGHFVNDAQLTTAASQTEMRIAMQTTKLGAIEIHARVSGDQVGAAIIVEKRDAHAALAVELPALQQSLSDKQLRVEQVALSQGSLSSTAGDAGASAQHNQRGTAQAPQSSSFWSEARTLSTAAWFVPEQTGIFNSQGRLSVQA